MTETVVDCWILLFQQLVKIWCQKSSTCVEKYVMYGDKNRVISFTLSIGGDRIRRYVSAVNEYSPICDIGLSL